MLKIEREMKLPIHEWFMAQSADAILFADSEGKIVAANQSAINLFHIKALDGLKLENMLDKVDLTKEETEEQITEMKVFPFGQVLVKTAKMDDYLCIIVKENQYLDSGAATSVYTQDGPYEGIVLLDDGKIVDSDRSLAEMFGYTRQEIIGKAFVDLVHSQDIERLQHHFEKRLQTPLRIRGMRQDGQMIYGEVLPEKISQQDKNLRIHVIRNVTEHVLNEKKIEFMAFYDELTDLPNRNYLEKVLQEELKRTRIDGITFALHMVTIDRLKQINDSMGYQYGDQLLYACAQRFKKLLFQDVFVARMSGDDFIVLQRLPENKSNIEQFSKQIIQLFEEPFTIGEQEFYSSVNIGISIYPDTGETVHELIKQAESALTASKDQAKNYLIYDPSMTEDAKEQLELETELRKAVQEKQLELHYQPQIDMIKKKVIGFEALCRWNHPTKGFIPPSVFIPLAEKTDLILELGEWVVREACRQNKEWQNQGMPHVKVSVNLSAKQFTQRNIVSQIKSILEETGLDPQYLGLEITESVAMSHEYYIIDTLKSLQELGVKIALDDFGTGYSSLRYLSQFPLSKLKIDRLFIQNSSKHNKAIVKTIISLSRALNLRVIAEGVEQKEELDILLEEKCDEVQGYYFSKPVPAKDVQDIFHVKEWEIS